MSNCGWTVNSLIRSYQMIIKSNPCLFFSLDIYDEYKRLIIFLKSLKLSYEQIIFLIFIQTIILEFQTEN